MENRWQIPFVIVMLLVSGCSSPAIDDPTTVTTESHVSESGTAPTDDGTSGESARSAIPVRGELDMNATLVFERVQRLLGTNVSTNGIRVIVRPREPSTEPQPRGAFSNVVGLVPPGTPPKNVTTGLAESGGTVHLIRGESPRWYDELVLVHEFVHIIQMEQGISDRFPDPEANINSNRYQVGKAVTEGTARYVEFAYAEEILNLNESSKAIRERRYQAASPYRKAELVTYYFGKRYVQTRVDGPDELSRVYEDPPRSMEQIIHGYRPDEEPPLNLTAGGVATNSSWTWTATAVKGEAYLRLVLLTELDRSHAATAATGWGTDRLLAFEHENRTENGRGYGYAWVLRWDDKEEATEFRTAFQTYLDRRGQKRNGTWQAGDVTFKVVTVTNETVVVLIGPETFVSSAYPEGGTDDVDIVVADQKS